MVETTHILHGNMNTMLERGDKVENLVRQSDALKSSANMFKRIVKKRAPTPPRGISDKIKVSFALSTIALVLAGVAVGTNQLIAVKVYPQNSPQYPTPVDNVDACVPPDPTTVLSFVLPEESAAYLEHMCVANQYFCMQGVWYDSDLLHLHLIGRYQLETVLHHVASARWKQCVP
jgi:hypothetical protein